MCRRHWFMVPKPLRDAVLATYRPGQRPGGDRGGGDEGRPSMTGKLGEHECLHCAIVAEINRRSGEGTLCGYGALSALTDAMAELLSQLSPKAAKKAIRWRRVRLEAACDPLTGETIADAEESEGWAGIDSDHLVPMHWKP
jgi:hypothetical protein